MTTEKRRAEYAHCQRCGRKFVRWSKRKIYHSDRCRLAAWREKKTAVKVFTRADVQSILATFGIEVKISEEK